MHLCMACLRCLLLNCNYPNFDRFDLSSLRTGVMAGSPCPVEVMKRCSRLCIWKMCRSVMAWQRHRPFLRKHLQTLHLKTGGHRWRGAGSSRNKIIDPETGAVADRTAGRWILHGYSIMLGYWNNPKANQWGLLTLRDGCIPATLPPWTTKDM